MEQKLLFTKVREVKSPQRGTPLSAGIDLFVPKFTDSFIEALEKRNPQINDVRQEEFEYFIVRSDDLKSCIILAPHTQIVIPSGIKILGNSRKVYPMMNKSGIATKKHLNRTAEVVDEDYGGEMHIAVQNTSNFMIKITEGQKIIQLLELDCNYSELEEISNDEYDEKFKARESKRGTEGFGSTGVV